MLEKNPTNGTFAEPFSEMDSPLTSSVSTESVRKLIEKNNRGDIHFQGHASNTSLVLSNSSPTTKAQSNTAEAEQKQQFEEKMHVERRSIEFILQCSYIFQAVVESCIENSRSLLVRKLFWYK